MKNIKLTKIILVLILCLAAFFRLYRISDYMEFLGDQGRDVVIVRTLFTQGHFLAIGPQTSVGNMYLGPFYYYLMAPSLLFANFNPVGPSIMVAMFGIATTFLLWRFGRQLFSNQSGLLAAFLFAISPVAIKYNSFSWNPNVMPFFALLFSYSLYQIAFLNKYKYSLLLSISFILCLNSHYLSLLLLPFGIYYVASYIQKNKQNSQVVKYLLMSLGIFVISLVPQILFDLKHHGQNSLAIINFFKNSQMGSATSAYLPRIIEVTKVIFTRLVAAKNTSFGLITLIYFLSSILIIIKSYPKDRQNILYLLFWIIPGIVGLSLLGSSPNDHYFGFHFPAIFLIFGYCLSKTKIIGYLFLIPIVILSFQNNPFVYAPNYQMATTQLIDKSIIADSNNQSFNLALLAKQNYDPPYRYFMDLYHGRLYTLEQQKTNLLYVICEKPFAECKPQGNPFWDVAAFGNAKVSEYWTINNVTIFKLTRI